MRQDSWGVESASRKRRRGGKQEDRLPRTFGSRAGRHRAAAVCHERARVCCFPLRGPMLSSPGTPLCSTTLVQTRRVTSLYDSLRSGAGPSGLPHTTRPHANGAPSGGPTWTTRGRTLPHASQQRHPERAALRCERIRSLPTGMIPATTGDMRSPTGESHQGVGVVTCDAPASLSSTTPSSFT
jgi:hypothetical protein